MAQLRSSAEQSLRRFTASRALSESSLAWTGSGSFGGSLSISPSLWNVESGHFCGRSVTGVEL